MYQKGVNGTGAIANLLRKVLDLKYSEQLDEHLDNKHCLFPPTPPDWHFNLWNMILPLLGMLLFQVLTPGAHWPNLPIIEVECSPIQVFFNFVVQRLVLFFVLGMVFPRRAKARIIHMYNRLLIARVNTDKLEAAKRKGEEENEANKSEG